MGCHWPKPKCLENTFTRPQNLGKGTHSTLQEFLKNPQTQYASSNLRFPCSLGSLSRGVGRISFPWSYPTPVLCKLQVLNKVYMVSYWKEPRALSRQRSFSFFLFKFTYLLCTQYFVYMPEEGTWSNYRWLWATIWVLETGLRSSERAASSHNC